MDHFFPDLHHFAFRAHVDISSDEAYSRIKDVLKKPVKKIDYRYSVAIAKEVKATRPHIQAYIVFAMPEKTLRQRLKEEFKLVGNKDWSFVRVKDKVSYLSYITKEKDIRYTPDLVSEIQNSPEWIEPEETEKDFNQDLKSLRDLYLSTEMSDYNFLLKLMELYSKHQKHIYIAHIRALWLGYANQRNRPLDKNGYRVCGNSRPFRHLLIEEIMRGFCIFD